MSSVFILQNDVPNEIVRVAFQNGSRHLTCIFQKVLILELGKNAAVLLVQLGQGAKVEFILDSDQSTTNNFLVRLQEPAARPVFSILQSPLQGSRCSVLLNQHRRQIVRSEDRVEGNVELVLFHLVQGRFILRPSANYSLVENSHVSHT